MLQFINQYILVSLVIISAILWWRGFIFKLGDYDEKVVFKWEVYSLKKWLKRIKFKLPNPDIRGEKAEHGCPREHKDHHQNN